MTTSRPLISVIVPVYNVEPYLDWCFDVLWVQANEDRAMDVNDRSLDRRVTIDGVFAFANLRRLVGSQAHQVRLAACLTDMWHAPDDPNFSLSLQFRSPCRCVLDTICLRLG